jgi:hypothetical protein
MANLFRQVMSEMKSRDYKDAGGLGSNAAFYRHANFCPLAEILRSHFEETITSAIDLDDGLTPLVYAFCPDTYQFLTATAERIFSGEVLEEFLRWMREWAGRTLNATFVSTPQVRVYINGCFRSLVRDSSPAGWHWMLSLGRNSSLRSGRIKLLVGDATEDSRGKGMRIDQILNLELNFNEFLVHRTNSEYGIELPRCDMNPLEGAILLDGYLG